MDCDPVCFDIKSGKKNRECRIVKTDLEEILCNNRVKLVAEPAPNFLFFFPDLMSKQTDCSQWLVSNWMYPACGRELP